MRSHITSFTCAPSCEGLRSQGLLCARRDSFYSGFMLARAKRSKLNILSMDLLAYQNGGESGIILPSSEGEGFCLSPLAPALYGHSQP